MYTTGLRGLGSASDLTARFIPRTALTGYVGNDPQTVFYFKDAVAAGLVADNADGERKFSVMWTASVADLLRAGEWRFRAWKYFEWLAWNVTAGQVDRMTGLNVVPSGTFTSAAMALQAARVQLAQDMASYRLTSADAQADASGWAFALSLPWPFGAQSVDAGQLMPAAPTPIELVSPRGIVTPITERAPLPTPNINLPVNPAIPVVATPVATTPSGGTVMQTMTPTRGGGDLETPVLDFGGGSDGNGVTGSSGSGSGGMMLLAAGAALLLFAGSKRKRRKR